MKPRFFCAECEVEIQWSDQFCVSCGKPVEWPADSLSRGPGESRGDGRVCNKCGSENAVDAGYCGSCGAALRPEGRSERVRQVAELTRRPGRQEKSRDSKKKENASGPLFSWKVILGFLGALLAVVVVLELSSTREQSNPQQITVASQMPTANLQVTSQIADLEKRVVASPNDMQSILALANKSHDGRFFDKAITYYKRFLDKNPRDANARVDLGICYYEIGNLDEAQKQMQTALKYDPKHIQGHFNLGIVNLQAQRLQEANEWFKKTIALAPGSDLGQQAKRILEQHSSPLIQNK